MINASANYKNIPQVMRDRPQWVVWKYGALKPNGKRAKVPYCPTTGKAASSTDSATWATYAQALTEYAKGGYTGLGYVLTQEDPYTFIDLDDCIRNGELDAGALAIIRKFGSYTERSVSGTGVHIVVGGKATNRKNDTAEVYSEKRFIAMTGEIVAEQRTIEARQETLDLWHKETFPAKQPKEAKESPKADSAALPADDDALLRIIRASKGADKFNRLWAGDTNGYINPKTGKPDPSRADGALCSILAYWTNSDAQRIDRMFRQSGLMRAKWDRTGDAASNRTYGQLTIDNAIGQVTRHYSPSKGKSDVALLVEANRATLASLPMRSATQRVILAILTHAERQNQTTLPISSRYISDKTGLSHRSAQMEMRLLCPQTRQVRIKRIQRDTERTQQALQRVMLATTAQQALGALPATVQKNIAAKRGAQGDAAVMAEAVIYLQNKIERSEKELAFYTKNEAVGNTFDLLTCNSTSDGSALANVYTVLTLQKVSTVDINTVCCESDAPPTVTIGHCGNLLQSSPDALQFIEATMNDDAFVKMPPAKMDPRLKAIDDQAKRARVAALLAPDEKLKPFGLSAPRVFAHLDTNPGADVSAIADAAHLSERTVRTVLKATGAALVEKGHLPLVEIIRQGRKLTYRLADDWRERLDALRGDLCTNGLIVARTIKHAGERIRRIEQFLAKNQMAPRKALDETTKAQYETIRDRARQLQKRLAGGGEVDKSAALDISEALTTVENALVTAPPPAPINRHYFDFSDAWHEWESLKARGFAVKLARQGEGFAVRL